MTFRAMPATGFPDVMSVIPSQGLSLFLALMLQAQTTQFSEYHALLGALAAAHDEQGPAACDRDKMVKEGKRDEPAQWDALHCTAARKTSGVGTMRKAQPSFSISCDTLPPR